ncbi:UMP kinase [Dichotomicrobium thermohalophilum]|uniref:Uridylate kinase n=1 Tax=Dichotomicrobium thermohalophilum TaxID=933063 RepID=A0A397QA94_9HYPH|nr:UMP kinase [Dichotomicrobium thermohalophilum]RIA56427.1 uridylate kinase [Dichotomicrobium thermohalophilum]
MAGTTIKYRRVLMKLSGEALLGSQAFGTDPSVIQRIAGEIRAAVSEGVQVALVIGGGNLFRGVVGAAEGMDRARADDVGMLATVMNALMLENGLRRTGVNTVTFSAVRMPTICRPFQREEARTALDAGQTVIFAGGTGSPFFTTDTTAALRAAEMQCDAILKGTSVDGVYSADPAVDPTAVRYDHLTYDDVLNRNLRVMDGAAIALARDNAIPIVVFSMHEPGSLVNVLTGQTRCTTVTR